MSKRRTVLSACWSCAAIAICLLLAATAVWATPAQLIELLARSQKGASAVSKAKRASLLLSVGKTEEALPVLEELIKAKRSENTAEGIALANKIELQVKFLKAERDLQTVKQLETAEQEAGLAQLLDQVPDPRLKLLREINSGLSRVWIVKGHVKRFSNAFEDGFRDPNRFLPEVGLHRPELLSEWRAAKQEKRIFVIGAGEDKAEIFKWAESWKSDGHAVFFYDFCRQISGELCREEAVGAMFGTSGQTFVYDTLAARRSEFVPVEIATAQHLAEGDRRVFLIPSAELRDSFSDGAEFSMYVANVPERTPSPVK
jgi:hypothetical protein